MLEPNQETRLLEQQVFDKMVNLCKEESCKENDNKEKNKKELLVLQSKYNFPKINQRSVLYQLALEGDQEAVLFFFSTFPSFKPAGAYIGAAEGHHLEFLEKLLKMNLLEPDQAINYAVQGAAHGNHEELVENLIERGANIGYAVSGAVMGGHSELLEKLEKKGDVSKSNIAIGFAMINNIEKTLQLIKEGASAEAVIVNAAAQGYHKLVNLLSKKVSKESYHMKILIGAKQNFRLKGNAETVLDYIMLFEDKELRDLLIAEAKKELVPISKEPFNKNLTRINLLMKEHQFDYKKARAWLQTNIHFWFLQGIQLVSNGQIPLEMFIYLSSFLTGLSTEETNKLFTCQREIMPRKLLDNAMNDVKKKFGTSRWSIVSYFFCFNPGRAVEEGSINLLQVQEERQHIQRYERRMNWQNAS